MNRLPYSLMIATFVLAGALPAAAQDAVPPQSPPVQPVYKCGNNTYTHVSCGGEQVGKKRVNKTFVDRHAIPPQDRARRMARAQLPPAEQKKCAALERQIRQEEVRLKGKSRSNPPTPAEEGDLAIKRVNYREMKC